MESSTFDAAEARTGGQSATTSQAVVSVVASTAGDDPMELPPLFDAIDPDALDALFESGPDASRSSGTVEFSYAGYRVRVGADGGVDVVGSAER